MSSGAGATRELEVEIPWRSVSLIGSLAIPGDARGTVLFAHGSGSSRHSPRNRFVARRLQDSRFATLLLDLLTRDEESRRSRKAAPTSSWRVSNHPR